MIPQQIATATEIEMDRLYIRIMPPNQESVERYGAHVKTEKIKKNNEKNRTENGLGKIGDPIE